MGSSKGAVAIEPDKRRAAGLADALRKEIVSGRLAGGRFLPSERALAKTHGLNGKTVRRALKVLESEALVAAESRRGYRVLNRANDPDKGCPLAFVMADSSGRAVLDTFYRRLLDELQGAAGRRGWSMLGVRLEGQSSGSVSEHLRAARACGAVVDSIDSELLKQIAQLGIPAVMADSWEDELQFDVVAQDGFAGGVLAASHLLARGHKRAAFLGLSLEGARAQVIERFGGAAAGLARGGLALAAGDCISYREGDPQDALAQARRLLSAKDRPTAVLALWQGASKAVAVAARELGLTVGRDFDMVGWSTEEDYAADWMREFPADQVPAAVTWSVKAMADICITRLMQRRADPKTPVTMTRVPVRLRLAKQEER